jgi:hypothetical protein
VLGRCQAGLDLADQPELVRPVLQVGVEQPAVGGDDGGRAGRAVGHPHEGDAVGVVTEGILEHAGPGWVAGDQDRLPGHHPFGQERHQGVEVLLLGAIEQGDVMRHPVEPHRAPEPGCISHDIPLIVVPNRSRVPK